MKTPRLLILGLMVISLSGCVTTEPAPKAAVTHVVFCWLKNPDDVAARARLTQVSKDFAKLPGVIEVRVGRPLPSDRPIVDSSYDLAIVMTFTDETALKAYLQHPDHLKATKEVLQALAKRVLIYDFVE